MNQEIATGGQPAANMPTDHCLSDYALDHLLADELAGPAVEQANEHLRACSACALRHEQLLAWRAEFNASPPEVLTRRAITDAPAVESDELAARRRASRRRRWWAGTGLLAVAATVLVMTQFARQVAPVRDQLTTRSKGSAHVSLYLHRDGHSRLVEQAADARPGDTLQFTYSTSAPGYLAILSRDGAGLVSSYFGSGERALAMTPGDEVSLPHSIVLDGVLGHEVLYIITCTSAIALSPLRAQLQLSAELSSIPNGCDLTQIVLDKRNP